VLSLSDAGRWLGGVCTGLARVRGTRAGWIRAGFIASTLIGGLGIIVHFACWLIIPREGEPTDRQDSGWIVVAAQVRGPSPPCPRISL
jgi:phage shock protein PspC (stress-responsive transcriptional regulator)